MTLSIIAIDRKAGLMGVGVVTGSIAVGSRVPWSVAGIGVVATQAYTNVSYGCKGLLLLKRGLRPKDVLSILLQEDPGREYRQVCIMNSEGEFAVFTGKHSPQSYGEYLGKDFCVIGNLLVGTDVIEATASAFEKTKSNILPVRILKALEAGVCAGGDKRGHRSAALIISETMPSDIPWLINLRVDLSENPINELFKIYEMYRASLG